MAHVASFLYSLLEYLSSSFFRKLMSGEVGSDCSVKSATRGQAVVRKNGQSP